MKLTNLMSLKLENAPVNFVNSYKGVLSKFDKNDLIYSSGLQNSLLTATSKTGSSQNWA